MMQIVNIFLPVAGREALGPSRAYGVKGNGSARCGLRSKKTTPLLPRRNRIALNSRPHRTTPAGPSAPLHLLGIGHTRRRRYFLATTV